MKNITTYEELIKEVEKKENKKVLMHVCCAPCSTACLDVLKDGFIVDLYFSNSNIDTIDEFDKRFKELERLNKVFNKGQVFMDEYKPNDFFEAIKGLEHLGEKSIRCYHCYELRMEHTARFAKEHHYDYFTTSLSLSPHKNAEWINEIGLRLAEKYQIPFLYSNFKLRGGFQKSIEYSKEFSLYRQNYCGCHYSKIERGIIDKWTILKT